jgi:hypothetical protein
VGTVTVLTAAKVYQIEANSVIGGLIDANGDLILNKPGGVVVNLGTVTVPVESMVHYLNVDGYNDTTIATSYPAGVSLMRMSAAQASAGWPTFSGKYGSICSINYSGTGETTQIWTRVHGTGVIPEQWIRSGNESQGWSAWKKLAIDDDIVALDARLDTAESTIASHTSSISANTTKLGFLPSRVASGIVTITPVANAATTVSITFPAGRFTSPPHMQVTANTAVAGTVQEVSASNVTATGCDISIYRSNVTATGVWWLAVQP